MGKPVTPCAHLMFAHISLNETILMHHCSLTPCIQDYVIHMLPLYLTTASPVILYPRKDRFSTTQHHRFFWTVAGNVTFLLAVKAFDRWLPPMLLASGCTLICHLPSHCWPEAFDSHPANDLVSCSSCTISS